MRLSYMTRKDLMGHAKFLRMKCKELTRHVQFLSEEKKYLRRKIYDLDADRDQMSSRIAELEQQVKELTALAKADHFETISRQNRLLRRHLQRLGVAMDLMPDPIPCQEKDMPS